MEGRVGAGGMAEERQIGRIAAEGGDESGCPEEGEALVVEAVVSDGAGGGGVGVVGGERRGYGGGV